MKNLNATIIKVSLIRNSNFDKIYEGLAEIIKTENNNDLNESHLLHGTSHAGAQGIIDSGFDDRWFKNGAWGFGAYFADDPRKSNGYAPAENGVQNIFICKVLLGKQ